MDAIDTIAAISTGIGGAISIIRISGKQSLSVANQIWQGKEKLGKKHARQLFSGHTVTENDQVGDQALAVYMAGPNSYTGEDMVEIHCHGGVLTTRTLLNATLSAGARAAEPGEFTYRAFVNGKLDLTQAEAVADLISAHSDMALHLAERQLAGRLRDSISRLREPLIEILAECESRLDFTEEDLDWKTTKSLGQQIRKTERGIQELLKSREEGIILRHGIQVVIAGCPNVGKSSLLNLLLGFDRAIVTQIPGTTRDTLEEFVHLRNIPVKLIDTAGIREADDLIEGIGIERSRESLHRAQVIFWLLDASSPDPQSELAELRNHLTGKNQVIAVWNKIDLKTGRLPTTGLLTAKISVTAQKGIDGLLDRFEEAVWGFPHTIEPEIAVSSRHASLLEEALNCLPNASSELKSENWELAAVQLRTAIASLGTITGEDADPDILETIFSEFCIGK